MGTAARLCRLRASLMTPSAGRGLPALPMRVVGRARHSVRAVHSQRALPGRCAKLASVFVNAFRDRILVDPVVLSARARRHLPHRVSDRC